MPWNDSWRWVYGIVVLVSLVILLVLSVLIVIHTFAPVTPVHIIHSGIGNALCTPSNVCTQNL